jgi:branched-chain amino acid transport system substrate-binding protein
VAFITSTDATGQDADQNIETVFGDANGPLAVVAHEHFNASDLSLSAQMAKIKASGANVLVAWTTGTPFGTVLRNAAEAGLGIPVLTTAGNLSDAEMHAFAAFLPKELYFPATPAFAPDQVPPGALKRSLESYFAALKAAGAKPENATSLAWDGTLLIVEALRKLGTNAGAAQIRDYIAGLRGGIGIYGPHDFVAIPQRGLGIGSVVMVRWDAAKGWVAASGLGVSATRQ